MNTDSSTTYDRLFEFLHAQKPIWFEGQRRDKGSSSSSSRRLYHLQQLSTACRHCICHWPVANWSYLLEIYKALPLRSSINGHINWLAAAQKERKRTVFGQQTVYEQTPIAMAITVDGVKSSFIWCFFFSLSWPSHRFQCELRGRVRGFDTAQKSQKKKNKKTTEIRNMPCFDYAQFTCLCTYGRVCKVIYICVCSYWRLRFWVIWPYALQETAARAKATEKGERTLQAELCDVQFVFSFVRSFSASAQPISFVVTS